VVWHALAAGQGDHRRRRPRRTGEQRHGTTTGADAQAVPRDRSSAAGIGTIAVARLRASMRKRTRRTPLRLATSRPR
jgi:hypothetical protein